MDALAKMLPDLPPVKTRGGSAQGKKEDDVSKPVRACARCGKVTTIQGRGQCGSCYHKELREEREAKKVTVSDSMAGSPVERLDDEETPRPVAYKPAEPEPLPRVDVTTKDPEPEYVHVHDNGHDEFVANLDTVLSDLRSFLIGKNKAYGNSAINPVRCFSRADRLEQINVRMDDKLSRMMQGQDAGEDPELDLLGYMVIKRVALLEDAQ